jgi:hypothetical protein
MVLSALTNAHLHSLCAGLGWLLSQPESSKAAEGGSLAPPQLGQLLEEEIVKRWVCKPGFDDDDDDDGGDDDDDFRSRPVEGALIVKSQRKGPQTWMRRKNRLREEGRDKKGNLQTEPSC